MTVTPREFTRALDNAPERKDYHEVGAFVQDFFWTYGDNPMPTVSILDGTVTKVAEGGGEGDGAPMWAVLSFEKDGATQYFRLDGQYSSWDSSYWDDAFYEVYPAEVTVIDWKRK